MRAVGALVAFAALAAGTELGLATLCALGAVWLAVERYVIGKAVYLNGVDASQINPDLECKVVVHGVLMFETEVGLAHLRKLLEERLLQNRRFKMLVRTSWWGWPWLEPCGDAFSLDNHLVSHALPGDGTDVQLAEFVRAELNTGLDMDKPLWKMVLITNYNQVAPGGSAVLMRMHHCLADGVAIMTMLTKFASGSAAETKTGPSQAAKKAAPAKPSAIEMAGSALSSTAKLLLLQSDPLSPYKSSVPISTATCAWLSESLDLAAVKMVGKAMNASVNDVLIAAAAGALRTHIINNKMELPKKELQTLVWVNLRPPTGGKVLEGNQIGAVYLKLPLHLGDPVGRVQFVKAEMAKLKNSLEPVVAKGLMSFFGMLPPVIMRPLWKEVAYKVTFSMSNLPGPSTEMHLGDPGPAIKRIMFFVPPIHKIGVFASIISYNNKVSFGMATDTALVKDPDDVVALFGEQIKAMSTWASAKARQTL